MTELKCNVTQCANNQSSLCALNAIKVDGQMAATKDETLCASFASQSSAPTNAVSPGSASVETEIRCDASDCTYNDGRLCSASYIYVQGSGAKGANSTRCDTFKPR